MSKNAGDTVHCRVLFVYLTGSCSLQPRSSSTREYCMVYHYPRKISKFKVQNQNSVQNFTECISLSHHHKVEKCKSNHHKSETTIYHGQSSILAVCTRTLYCDVLKNRNHQSLHLAGHSEQCRMS